MKIFIVHEDIYHAGNPYIYTLVKEIKKISSKVEINYGREGFWNETIFNYDIVHFQWPQAFMAGDSHQISDLENHIKRLKSHGVKIVSTCHDLKPHYNQCADYGDCMNIVYKNSDVIFHLGNYSLLLFQKQYPDVQHWLLPHQIFDTVYTKIPSQKEAKIKLKLNPNKKYILCFGAFRADEERELVLNVAKYFKKKKVEILAPSFLHVPHRRKIPFLPNHLERKSFIYRLFYKIHMTGNSWTPVSDDMLPYYYMAADLCLIQRKKILNSGNAILPLLFNKVVVGPNVGNVGPLLKEMGFPTFDPKDESSILSAVSKGLSLINENYPASHFKDEFSTFKVATKMLEYYVQILTT